MKRISLLPVAITLLISHPALAQRGASDAEAIDNIYEVIDRVADELNKEIIVDPRIREMRQIPEDGVYQQVPRPQAYTTENRPDYESLQALLRAIDFVAVETADQILIMPEDEARGAPGPLLQEDDPNVSDHAFVTRVIVVPDGFSSANLVPVLRPMIGVSGQFAAVPNGSELILVDRYDNVRRITAVIEEIIGN